jgi:hypothetical protein
MLMKFNEFLFLESVGPSRVRPLNLCINSINTCCLCHEETRILYMHTNIIFNFVVHSVLVININVILIM